jgi:hypothetical protein
MNTRAGRGNFEWYTEELVPISVTNRVDTTNHLSAFVEEDANSTMPPDYSSPEIISLLDVSYPPTSHDKHSPRPLVLPDTNESPDIRHSLSNSCLDYEAPFYQSDILQLEQMILIPNHSEGANLDALGNSRVNPDFCHSNVNFRTHEKKDSEHNLETKGRCE